MDALTKLNDNFLTCNICTEIYKDPCTLECYHTFCRGCLTKYTKTRRDAITAKSILCPNCKQMTKVPQPQEPVDQWSQQRKPSFLIQGLLDTFSSQDDSDPVEQCCFTCQQTEKTTQAKSVCEDCDIELCESCAKVHMATPMAADHVITPLGAASTQLKKRKVMCKEHNCLVEFCCKDCQKAVCSKCVIFYHKSCHSVVTLESMIPEMKHVLQQNYQDINSHIKQAGNILQYRRSKVENITQHKSSLQSDIRRVSKQAVDLIRRKEKKLLDKLDVVIEKQTGELRGQIKSEETDMQTYQWYIENMKQVLQSNSPVEMYDMYSQSGEITAEIQRNEKPRGRLSKVKFEEQLDVDHVDRTLHLGHLKSTEDTYNFEYAPKLLSTVSIKSKEDTEDPNPCDIEVLNIDGTETLVVADNSNSSVKSCFTKGGKQYCNSVRLDVSPFALTKIGKDQVAVSHLSHNSIELIKLTPDPVLLASVKTKKNYRCLTALHDTTLAAGCNDPASIDVLNLSGRVLKSVITPSTGQQLIRGPRYMCTTRQRHILMVDDVSGSVCCVTDKGRVLFTYNLTSGHGGVITTDTGSVIVADFKGNKIVQLTDKGEFLRDLLTGQDGIVSPRGLRVDGYKLYVTQRNTDIVNIYQ